MKEIKEIYKNLSKKERAREIKFLNKEIKEQERSLKDLIRSLNYLIDYYYN